MKKQNLAQATELDEVVTRFQPHAVGLVNEQNEEREQAEGS